jgi:hypothetical protein
MCLACMCLCENERICAEHQVCATTWTNNRKKDIKLAVSRAYYLTFLCTSHLESYGLPGIDIDTKLTIFSSLNSGRVTYALYIDFALIISVCFFCNLFRSYQTPLLRTKTRTRRVPCVPLYGSKLSRFLKTGR